MQTNKGYTPHLIAWEVTRTCHLKCQHCRAGAENKSYHNELDTASCLKVLENIASFSKPIIILTGGEPMLREDIYDLASYGNKLGLTMVMAPCGTLVDENSIGKIKNSGIKCISLSLDGSNKESHDSFRNIPGSFDSVIKAAKLAKKSSLEFQINTTIHKDNIDQIPSIIDLAISLGAKAFHPFLLVPTGRAQDLIEKQISGEDYEKVLNWLNDFSNKTSLVIKPTCAPHYKRIHIQNKKTTTPTALHSARGCMGGISFAFISHTGSVYICGFLDVEAGDLRKNDYNFNHIWKNSPLFLKLRNNTLYEGKCSYCEFLNICGGCRARAYALSGNYLAEEPFCAYQPINKVKIT